jgi:hypothetical protein
LWLALVALALTLVAPSISRILYAWSSQDAAMVSMAGEHAGHGGHGHTGMPSHPGMPMHGDDVCGYCTLMCHSPVLTSGVAFTILPLPRTPYLAALGKVRAPVPALLEHRSRGPPAV